MFIFRLILLFILFYLLLRFLGRLLFSFTFSRQHRTSNPYQHYHTSSKKEGEVSVSRQADPQTKRFSKNDGEYIRFEEVE